MASARPSTPLPLAAVLLLAWWHHAGIGPATAAAATATTTTTTTAAAPALPAAASNRQDPCPRQSGPVAIGTAQWNGWGRDLDNSRYQPEPALRAVDVPKLALRWAYGYDGPAVYGQPTVVDGRLFVTSSSGRVYSLDARTGCTYWTFDASAGVGTSILVGELGVPKLIMPPRPRRRRWSRRWPRRWRRHAHINAHIEVIKPPSAVFFGDQAGVVYSLNAATGALLWKTRLDAHADARVTGAPSLYENRLYVPVTWSEPKVAANSGKGCCTLQGAVEALDSATGAVVWKTDLRQVQAGAAPLTAAGTPIWSAPTVDPKRGLLYIAAGNCEAIVALDLTDGKPRWFTRLAAGDARKTDEDRIFGNSPILRQMTSGRQVILAGQQAGLVYGLDPDHAGAVLWRTRVATGGEADGVEWSPAADHRSLYVAIADVHPEQRRDRGGIAALDIATGELRWSAPSPQPSCGSSDINCSFGQAQAVTVIPGILFAGSIDGHLRAYSTIDGKLVWDFDTAKTYRTVNGSTAAGGPLGHGGPTIVSGMVYVNSGYGGRPGSPGHVLLAFSVGGK